MTDGTDREQVADITAFVDVEARPPDDEPTALLLFGSNQAIPVAIAAERHRAGLAPLIIVTGGVNRHNGIVEGRAFRRLLIERGVPAEAIRCEDRSANTWQNVEFALPYLEEVLYAGMTVTVVAKWYHRRAVHMLKTLLPGLGAFYAIGWQPLYGGEPLSRASWPSTPDGRRRVMKEWAGVTRGLTDGSLADVRLVDGMWR